MGDGTVQSSHADGGVKEFHAVVTDIRLESRVGTAGTWQMALDQTLFQPGATGKLEAVTRSGTRLEIPVSAVMADEDGTMWHVVEKPLAAGTEVRGTVLGDPGASP